MIARDIFTRDRFRVDVDQYLYLFQHCASKSCCEAVIEGMGSVWDEAARPGRHLSLEESSMESVVSWSAPQPYLPEVVPLATRANDHHFGKDKPWNVTHTDGQERNKIFPSGSKVLQKHRSDKLRLPSAMY